MPYMSISMQWEATSKAAPHQNKSKLHSIVKIEHGNKKSCPGHKFILCIIDEMTNYLITVPIYQAKPEEKGEALIENMITKYCIPEYIIMDQDSVFMSSLMTYLLNKFNIKMGQ